MTDKEKWRPVVGYRGYYEVSDHGRVRSIARYVGNKNPTSRTFMYGQILKGSIDRIGRPYVRLTRNNKPVQFRISRLVLLAFTGPCPPGMECCHNDGNSQNNHLSNLRWDTRTNNIRDAVRHGTHQMANRTHCPKGHEYTPENTHISNSGGRKARICKECRRRRGREHYARYAGKRGAA